MLHFQKIVYYSKLIFNGNMDKVGRSASQKVIIELVLMKYLPTLLYDMEECSLAKTDISSMKHFLNCTIGKIFIVKQQESINECRKAFSHDNFNEIIKNGQLKIIAKLPVSNNIICKLISYI